MNLAGVEPAESTTGLETSLGRAGLKHIDPQDCPQAYSALFAIGNLPKFNIDPGRFHCAELGVYCKLVNYRVLYFSGLHFHGGSPPRAAPNTPIPKEATRAVLILYCNNHICSNESGSVVGVTGKGSGSGVEVYARMRFDELLQEAADTGSLNYIRDGVSIMSIPSYKKFICRQLATLLEVLLRCCPHIKLNPEALAILFLDKATNIPLDAISTWEYAPGMDAAKRLEMKTFTQKMAEEQLRIAMTIPSQLKRMDGKTIGKDKDTGEFKAIPQSQVKAMAAAMAALKLKKKKAKGRKHYRHY